MWRSSTNGKRSILKRTGTSFVTLLAVATLFVWYFVISPKPHSSIIPILATFVPGIFAGLRRKRERQLKEDLKISERWQAKKEGRPFTE
jgi:hypothetical protein